MLVWWHEPLRLTSGGFRLCIGLEALHEVPLAKVRFAISFPPLLCILFVRLLTELPRDHCLLHGDWARGQGILACPVHLAMLVGRGGNARDRGDGPLFCCDRGLYQLVADSLVFDHLRQLARML